MLKIFVAEYDGENAIGGKTHAVIVVAAHCAETAREYVKEKIGIDVQPTWLMGAEHPTIYERDGRKPAAVQAKILYNGCCSYSRPQ